MNKYAKALKLISSKRNKTDADFIEMQQIEWKASLYTENGKVVLISEGLEAAFIAGARKAKLGKQAQAGLFIPEHSKLEFDGDDLSIDELFERDQNRLTCGVRVQRNRIMRTRFKAAHWAASVKLEFNDELLDRKQVEEAIRVTGDQLGIFDWRPKHGRFKVDFLT